MISNKANTLTILYLIESAGGGGAETVVAGLASARPDHAHVASLRSGWLQEQLTSAGIPCTKLPYRRRSDLLLALSIAKQIRCLRPDIVHCHCFTMNTVGALGAALARTPSIGTLHGTVYDLGTRKRRYAYRLAGAFHRRMVTVSSFLCDELHSQSGIPLAKIEVIYNGIPDPPADNHDRERIRREFGLSESDYLVGAVGMLRPEKGHADLLDALTLALPDVPEINLILVGDGKCRRDLERTANDLGISSAVHFASFRSDISALLRAMDVFALPSHTEGLSIATIEAMGCGIPVVVTDCGGPSEVVTDHISGLLVPPRDPAAMAAALVQLAKDNDLRGALAANGFSRARESFSLDSMISQYEQLYAAIARGGCV